MGKRCFSKCRKLKEENCSYPCNFLPKGYCRLSSTLKMVPPSCDIVKKTSKSKKNKVQDRLCIQGVCLLESLRTFFKQKTFEYETSRSELIEYRRGEFTAHAILRKGTVHEYLIGKELRHYLNKVPSFVDTYGVFRGKKPADLKRDCLKEVNVLIEHLKGSKTLREIHSPHFYIYDALYVFYQIYYTLYVMRSFFTHGQLTCENVMIYELPGYIEYHYPSAVFRSKYLVKLVNYQHSVMERVKGCPEIQGKDDLWLLNDYARVSRMVSHSNKYIQGVVNVFKESQTVSEAEHRFRELIQDPIRKKVNEKTNLVSIGELHIYLDRPMHYVSHRNE